MRFQLFTMVLALTTSVVLADDIQFDINGKPVSRYKQDVGKTTSLCSQLDINDIRGGAQDRLYKIDVRGGRDADPQGCKASTVKWHGYDATVTAGDDCKQIAICVSSINDPTKKTCLVDKIEDPWFQLVDCMPDLIL